MYTRAGRPREGVKICEQLVKIDPKNATYALMKGVLLVRLKRFDAATTAMRKVIELSPKRAVGYRSLVKVLLLRRETLAEAKAVARKVVELAPTAGHYSLLGEACLRNGDRAGALAAIKRAAELAPDNEGIQRAYKRLQERQ
jgi:Flp pilus assembly protein TadD